MSRPSNASRNGSQRRWSPHPPTAPGIFLFCPYQGAPLERFVVEQDTGRLRASHIGEGDWRPVRAMTGWWCREDESTGYTRQTMESDDGPEPDLMRLEWLL